MAHSTKGGILEEWHRILAINLTGYFLCIQHAGRMMYAQGTAALSISPLVPASARAREARPML